jgi:hypothetical protein
MGFFVLYRLLSFLRKDSKKTQRLTKFKLLQKFSEGITVTPRNLSIIYRLLRAQIFRLAAWVLPLILMIYTDFCCQVLQKLFFFLFLIEAEVAQLGRTEKRYQYHAQCEATACNHCTDRAQPVGHYPAFKITQFVTAAHKYGVD